MEATLKETTSSLEQLQKEHLALKEIVHQITRRNDALEERIDAVERTVPDASDVDSTDNDHDEMVVIETPDQGVPELNNDSTIEQHTLPVAGNRMQLLGLFGRRTGRENARSPIVNTETIHMYALSVTRKCATSPTKWGRVWSWVMSSMSLILVCSQMIVLLSLLFEGESPTCKSHTDCFGGLFCAANIFSYESILPRCVDCQHMILDDINKNECTEMMPGWQSIEEVDENLILFDQSSEAYIKEFNISNFDENKKVIMSNCLAWKHCENTNFALFDGLSEYTCPHLFLKIQKLSWDVLYAFILCSILFASVLSQDIEEAAVEYMLLDFSIQSLPADKSMPLSAFVIRITNRIRMYIIPALAGAAGSSIILSGNPSTNGIMLNLVAVLFIIEADNLFASLFLSPYQQVLGDDLAQDARNEGNDKYSSWVGTIYPLLISSTMVLLTVEMHDLITVLEKWYNQNWGCGGNFWVLTFYIDTMLICGILGVWMITSDERDRKIIRNLLDFSRIVTSTSLYTICMSLFIFLAKIDDDVLDLLVTFTVVLLWSIIVGVRCHQALDISTQLSWKSYLINVIVGIIWIILLFSSIALWYQSGLALWYKF